MHLRCQSGWEGQVTSKRRKELKIQVPKNDEKSIDGNKDTEAWLSLTEREVMARRKSVNISHEKEVMVCFQGLSLQATGDTEGGTKPGLKAAWCSRGQSRLSLVLKRGRNFSKIEDCWESSLQRTGDVSPSGEKNTYQRVCVSWVVSVHGECQDLRIRGQ